MAPVHPEGVLSVIIITSEPSAIWGLKAIPPANVLMRILMIGAVSKSVTFFRKDPSPLLNSF